MLNLFKKSLKLNPVWNSTYFSKYRYKDYIRFLLNLSNKIKTTVLLSKADKAKEKYAVRAAWVVSNLNVYSFNFLKLTLLSTVSREIIVMSYNFIK